MEGRVYPREELKNQIAETIYWFYVVYMEKDPDATSYSSWTKRLKPLFKPGANLKGARSYTSREVADFLYHLRDCGAKVDNLSVLFIPDFLKSYLDKDSEHFDKTLKWYMSVNGKMQSWMVPDGW